MLKTLACAAATLVIAAESLSGQSASIRGVVRDSLDRPMANADLLVIPSGRRARTDSTGRFAFLALEGRGYTVRARRVGYLPTEWSVDLSKGGHADVQITLATRVAVLDTIRVLADRRCHPQRYEGFLCRQASTRGVFLDYTDIDTMQVFYTADLLRDIGGFETVVVSSKNGATRAASSKWCTISLLNGVPAAVGEIPTEPYMISAIEIYKNPRDIPKEYRRYTWGRERCQLVVYWSYDFEMREIKKLALPRRRFQAAQ